MCAKFESKFVIFFVWNFEITFFTTVPKYENQLHKSTTNQRPEIYTHWMNFTYLVNTTAKNKIYQSSITFALNKTILQLLRPLFFTYSLEFVNFAELSCSSSWTRSPLAPKIMLHVLSGRITWRFILLFGIPVACSIVLFCCWKNSLEITLFVNW